MLQPLVIIYIAYFRHQKTNVPLDLVVKLFFVGFFWSSASSMVIEGILMGVGALALALFTPVVGELLRHAQEEAVATPGFNSTTLEPGEVPLGGSPLNVDDGFARDLLYQQPMVAVLAVFFFAFIVAASTEELMKHGGFSFFVCTGNA